jgi:hypothetical protein
MSRLLIPGLAAAMISGAWVAPAAVAGDVGISINIGEPGFYGRLDIGNFPQPEVIYTQPVLIERSDGYESRPPLYLRVPPGHEKHWRQHCREYNACGQPVYFVRDQWYRQTYAPQVRGHGQGHERDDHGNKHRDDHGDKKRDDHGEQRD